MLIWLATTIFQHWQATVEVTAQLRVSRRESLRIRVVERRQGKKRVLPSTVLAAVQTS